VLAGWRRARLWGRQPDSATLNLPRLQDVTGGCERLLRTPVPLAYTR
jgi:predicted membrane chloride channel (bestrophin family)